MDQNGKCSNKKPGGFIRNSGDSTYSNMPMFDIQFPTFGKAYIHDVINMNPSKDSYFDAVTFVTFGNNISQVWIPNMNFNSSNPPWYSGDP